MVGSRSQLAENFPVDDRGSDFPSRLVCGAVDEGAARSAGQGPPGGATDMKAAVLMAVTLALCCHTVTARASVWPLWDHYAAHFLTPEGRVIDPERNSMTTSEGQSYAMFFALVAGDSVSFERIRAWTEENLAQGDL